MLKIVLMLVIVRFFRAPTAYFEVFLNPE